MSFQRNIFHEIEFFGDPAHHHPFAFFTKGIDATDLDASKKLLYKLFSAERILTLRQTHSVIIHDVAELFNSKVPAEGDGFYARSNINEPILLAIKTADCVPLLLINEDELVFLHVGWRGLAGGLVERGLKLFRTPVLEAIIGPHAAVNDYEVGREILQEFSTDPVIQPHTIVEKCYLNMAGSIQNIIRNFSESIAIRADPISTVSDLRFFSVRREGAGTGRNLSIVRA